MEGFHSTVSRRDFMKGLGLAGIGVGALTAPAFADLDQLTATSSTKNPTHSWWVSERNLEDPTIGIDWNLWKAYDAKVHPMAPDTEIRLANLAKNTARNLQNLNNATPGYSLKEVALTQGLGSMYGTNFAANSYGATWPWDGATGIVNPSDRGSIGVWQDTPENNLQTMRAAMHLAGCDQVGVIELTDRVKQRIFDANTTVFEDIPQPLYKDGIYHVPSKCRWIMTFAGQNNRDYTMLTLQEDSSQPGGYGWSKPLNPHAQAYASSAPFYYMSSKMIKSLGYMTLRPPILPNVALGVLSGIGELGRHSKVVNPSHGTMIRMTFYWVTDLPLTPTPPIDFGLSKFCKNCATCAKGCPSTAIPTTVEPSWDTSCTTNNPGIKQWYIDWQKCRDWGSPGPCANCQAMCPYNSPGQALIHTVVAATAGNIGALDKFYATLEAKFEYARPRSDQAMVDWWNRDLKTYKGDAIIGAGKYDWR